MEYLENDSSFSSHGNTIELKKLWNIMENEKNMEKQDFQLLSVKCGKTYLK